MTTVYLKLEGKIVHTAAAKVLYRDHRALHDFLYTKEWQSEEEIESHLRSSKRINGDIKEWAALLDRYLVPRGDRTDYTLKDVLEALVELGLAKKKNKKTHVPNKQ